MQIRPGTTGIDIDKSHPATVSFYNRQSERIPCDMQF